MGKKSAVGISFVVEGEKELREGIRAVDAQIKVTNETFKLFETTSASNGDAIAVLTEKEKLLRQSMAEQEQKLDTTNKLWLAQAKAIGETSEVTLKTKKEYVATQNEIEKLKKQLVDTGAALTEVTHEGAESGRTFQNFSKEIGEATGNINVHKAELAEISERYADNADSTEKAGKEQELYGKISAQLTKKMMALKEQMDLLSSAGKENSDEFKGVAKQYYETSSELIKCERQAKNAAQGNNNLGDSAKKVGTAAQGSTKGIGAMTVAMGELIAKGIEMAVTGLLELTEKMREYNTDMSKLAQNASDAGVSQEALMLQMKELNFVTGETDSNIEALSNLMAAGFKDNNLGKAVETLSGAVIKFPDTMKIESLADSLQETLATGEATGQFAELLGRVGIEAESFNEKLERQIRIGREQQFVLDTLAKVGLPQVAQEYSKTNAEQKAYADAQFELNESMAQIAKEMVPLMTEVTEEINSLLQEHSEEIVKIIELIAMVAEIVFQVIGVLAMVPAPVWAVIAGIIVAITALIKISEGFTAAKTALDFFTGGMTPAKMQLMQIIGVVLALAGVLALLAMLWLAIKEGSEKAVNSMQRMQNVQISPPQVNQPQVKNAYAKGTLSAANGWALVGEEGPELVAFSGGERVMNARKTSALLSDGISDSGNGAYIANLNIYPNAQQWGEVMNLLKQSKRAEQERRKR